MAELPSQFGSSSPVEQLVNGDRIGQYVIVQPIRTDSYATSYTARDPIINRSVLIQQVHLTGSTEDETIRQRVKDRTSKTRAVTMASPTLWAAVLDVVDEPRGVFIITEWIEGQTLAEVMHLDPLPMPMRQVMGIVAAAAKALKPLHQKGLAHADLEPMNILMTSEGGLRLTNAGIAAAADVQYALNMPAATYMAPEILRGEEVDARADLYALGVIAYRLLAGEEKFSEAFKVVVRDQRNEAMRWMKWHTNPRANVTALHELLPPQRDPEDNATAVVQGVSEGVSAIVMRLMQKSPSARFANADELIEAIRRYFIGGTSMATSDAATSSTSDISGATALSEPGHTTHLPKKKSPVVTALAVMLGTWVILAVIIGGTLYNRQRNESLQQYNAIVETLDLAKMEMDSGRYAEAQKLYQKVADVYDQNTRFGLISRAGMLRAKADSLMVARDFIDARLTYLELEKLNAYDNEKIRVWIAAAEEKLAFQRGANAISAAIEAGEFTRARELLASWDRLVTIWSQYKANPSEREQLTRLEGQLRQKVTAENVETQLTRATALWASGRRDEAVSYLALALEERPDNELLRPLYEQYSIQEEYDALIRQADAARAAGNPGQAVNGYQKANQLYGQHGENTWFQSQPQIDRKLQEARMELAFQQGSNQLQQGNMDEARQRFEASVAMARALGIDAATTPAQQALNNLAASAQLSSVLAQAEQAMNDRDFEKAQALFRQALSIESTPETAGRLEEARFRSALQDGLALLGEGKLDEAEMQLQRAAQIRPGDSSVERGISELKTLREYKKLMDDAQAARASKRFGEAKRLVSQAEELAEASDGVIDPQPVALLGDEIEYEHLMALAMGYYEAKQYRLSHASLRGAMELRDTDEARALLERLEPFLIGVIENQDNPDRGDSVGDDRSEEDASFNEGF